MTTALGLLADRAWAMYPPVLETLRRVTQRERAERGGEEWITSAVEGLQAAPGRRMEGTRSVTVRDGVAVIPVVGPLFRRANLLTQISGATSTELLARDLRSAVEAPETRAVVLEIDSPGGEAMGIAELAQLVRELDKRKPVYAYADGYCCSGAYWIAAACRRIYAASTAILGSIGVVVTLERSPEEEIVVVSSASPKKRMDPATEEGQAECQRWVDQLAEVFIRDVARYRGVSEQRVATEFGRGGVLVGEHARAAGLVDEIGTLEGLLLQLAPSAMERSRESSRAELEPGPNRELKSDLESSAGAAARESEEVLMEAGAETAAAQEAQQLRQRLDLLESSNELLRAQNAALEAAESRRGTLETLAEKRFCEGAYALAPASRERLATELAALDPERRAGLVETLAQLELMPLGTSGFQDQEGGPATEAEALSAADRAVIRAEAKRRRAPEKDVQAQFLAARRERQARREGGEGD